MGKLLLFFGICGFLYGQDNGVLPARIISELMKKCRTESRIRYSRFHSAQIEKPRLSSSSSLSLSFLQDLEYLVAVYINFETPLGEIQWVRFNVKMYKSCLGTDYITLPGFYIPKDFLVPEYRINPDSSQV